jgi:hypothetical protein
MEVFAIELKLLIFLLGKLQHFSTGFKI